MTKYFTLYDNGKPKPMPKKVKIGNIYFKADKGEWKNIQKRELREYKKLKRIK